MLVPARGADQEERRESCSVWIRRSHPLVWSWLGEDFQ
jgi:hypothetical protein